MTYFSYRLLFNFEDIVIEEHVKFFVGVVYAKLFKGVGCEVLEAKDIQNTNELCHVLS